MNAILDWAFVWTWYEAVFWLFVQNAAMVVVVVIVGQLLTKTWTTRRIVGARPPLSSQEVFLAISSTLINTLIAVMGWWLWKTGILKIRLDTGWRAWLDFPILILLMDFGMYALHRVAHSRWMYPIHRIHHEYDKPWVLTLFVMHPLESFSFGLFWLFVICVYSSSWLGLTLYLTANLLAGMLGHLGVEPFPKIWSRLPLLRELGTSTFHAQHHQEANHNFGFYTVIWDRLFGTLFPGYDAEFASFPPSDREQSIKESIST